MAEGLPGHVIPPRALMFYRYWKWTLGVGFYDDAPGGNGRSSIGMVTIDAQTGSGANLSLVVGFRKARSLYCHFLNI